MNKTLVSCSHRVIERRDDREFPQSQSRRSSGPARGSELLEGAEAGLGVRDGREAVQAASGRGAEQVPEDRQAVDRLADGGELELLSPVPVFHRPMLLEESDNGDGAFDASDQPEFVVEPEDRRPHVVLDPGRDVVPELILEAPGELAAQEGDDLGRPHRGDGGGGEGPGERLQVGLALENGILFPAWIRLCQIGNLLERAADVDMELKQLMSKERGGVARNPKIKS